jgi:hypothetical protein
MNSMSLSIDITLALTTAYSCLLQFHTACENPNNTRFKTHLRMTKPGFLQLVVKALMPAPKKASLLMSTCLYFIEQLLFALPALSLHRTSQSSVSLSDNKRRGRRTTWDQVQTGTAMLQMITPRKGAR